MNPASQPYNDGPDSAHPSTSGEGSRADRSTHEAGVSQQALEDEQRARFEAWVSHLPMPFHRRDFPGSERHGQYSNPHTQRCWEAWCAAEAQKMAPGGIEESFKPHPRWKGDRGTGVGSDRHPGTLEEWNWRTDVAPDALQRSRRRLNVAADYADDRAPDQMAVVLRIDLIRVLMSLTHQTARADSLFKRITALDRWRDAVLDALALTHIDPKSEDPREILRQVIRWHEDVALDPSVSERAAALVAASRDPLAPEPGCMDCAHNGRFLCDTHGPESGAAPGVRV